MSKLDGEPPSFLLLLPPASYPVSHLGLKTDYEDTLTQVLQEVASASHESDRAAVLEIALACSHLAGKQNHARITTYQTTQSLIAGLYKLICVIAAKEKFNIEDADGVDVRVILIAWSPNESDPARKQVYGPVIDLDCLAACSRPWQYAFGVESPSGEAFVKAFVAAKRNATSTQAPRTTSKDDSVTTRHQTPAARHHQVAVGGTFDHIHVGHKLLLTMTLFAVDEQEDGADEARILVIGITGDELLKNKKYAEHLESWHSRQQSVHRFLAGLLDFRPDEEPRMTVDEVNKTGPNGHAVNVTYSGGLVIQCVEIWDPFGPTITEKGISCLVLSGETRSGGKAVNDKRVEQGWPSLDVLEVDVLDPEEDTGNASTQQNNDQASFNSKLSSTEIRRKLATKTSASL